MMSVDSRKLRSITLTLAMLLAATAIALHAPGHVSMDSSMQLYEASIGQSVSWNPPFMSALMRWLGGGEIATTGLVLLSSLLTYFSLAYAFGNGLRAQSAAGYKRLPLWRAMLGVALILNPIFLIYVGIVWKDVFFASLLTAAVSLSFAAAVADARRALVFGAATIVLLAASMEVRQQGIFMAPVLSLLPLIAVLSRRGWTAARKGAVGIGLVMLFLLSSATLDALVGRTVAGSGDASSSVGFRSIMHFDMAGTVALSESATGELPVELTEEQREAIRGVYSSERIDYLGGSPVVSAWFAEFDDHTRKNAWWSLATQETEAFLSHKLATYATILDMRGIEQCLPVHIGVDGNNEYLKAVGITPARDSRDLMVYSIASKFFGWPLYRHWFYALGLLVVAGVLVIVRLPPRFKSMSWVVAAAAGLFYLSYLPTAISCDFRYLYSGVCLVTLLWLVVIAAAISPRQPRVDPEDNALGR